MSEQDNHPETVAVRQGVAPGIVRPVLAWSLVLAVVGLVLAFVLA